MSSWIYQGNPDRFDIDSYLENNSLIYWSVTNHHEQVKLDDTVYIWRAAGSKKAISGVVAMGLISEECKPKLAVTYPSLLGKELWTEKDDETSEVKAGIRLIEKRLSPESGMLLAKELKLHEEVSKMAILTVRTGTNFLLKQSEADELSRLWDL